MSLCHERSRERPDDLVSQLSQASCIIPKCHDVNERKCSDQQSLVKRRQCQDVADTVYANANKRKFQTSKRPVHAIVVEVIVKIKINEMLK